MINPRETQDNEAIQDGIIMIPLKKEIFQYGPSSCIANNNKPLTTPSDDEPIPHMELAVEELEEPHRKHLETTLFQQLLSAEQQLPTSSSPPRQTTTSSTNKRMTIVRKVFSSIQAFAFFKSEMIPLVSSKRGF